MPRGGDRSAQAKASGKKVGRPPKAKIPQLATKGIATSVLGALGTKYRNQQLPSEADIWLGLVLQQKDPRLRLDTMKYLTDRRDGKPAQGVFIGDTRENAPELDFGDLLMPAAPAKSRKADTLQ